MNTGPRDHSDLPLDRAIQQQLAQEVLDAGQLQQLLAMQQAVLDDREGTPDEGCWRRWHALAAACATLVLCIALAWQSIAPAPPDYTREIALEVVQNHLKLKPLDIETQSIGAIQGFFTQLDFSPVNSSLLQARFSLPEPSLLGGRYCSIRGVSAAQLRYRAGDDGLGTLYEVAYDSEAFGPMPHVERGETPTELLLKGLRVSLWVEKGLLLVLVTEA